MNNTILKVAIFGCGKMGLHHVKAISLRSRSQLVGVADPRADSEKLSPLLPSDCKIYKNPQELLESLRPDVVHIVTPPDTHTNLAKLAIEYGANIYVEKPFALKATEAETVIELAKSRGLLVCAAHQVLFQKTAQQFQQILHEIDEIIHIESYFSFKTARKNMPPIEQVIDILPHPVYLMLRAFDNVDHNSAKPLKICSMKVDHRGEVRVIVEKGSAVGTLIVTLEGRPVESYLKIVGRNGSINADFVLSGVTKLAGPGSSAISAVLKPYRVAYQTCLNTSGNILGMIFKKQKSYSGLAEIIEDFHTSIQEKLPSPVSSSSILETVKFCEMIGDKLRDIEIKYEEVSLKLLKETESRQKTVNLERGYVLITGGTGFLGRITAALLRSEDWPVRVIARRIPSPSNRLPGVEYVQGDIAESIPENIWNNVSIVVHLAAETIGGLEEHQRNTVLATQNIIESAKNAGVIKFINISSIAVLIPGSKHGAPLSESSPCDLENLARGPYVWGKAKAEKEVAEMGKKYGMNCRTIRLGPLVDFKNFSAPGRLGREVGPLYVAMGNRKSKLSVCDVHSAAEIIKYYIENLQDAPAILNLVEPDAPTRAELVRLLKKERPDLTIFWIPNFLLVTLSNLLKIILRMMRPKKKPIDLHAAFSAERYDSSLAASVFDKLKKSEL